MRTLALILIALLWVVSVWATDVNISTVEKNGSTLFYLQAGAFNLEKDAKNRQEELSKLVSEPIVIKNLSDQSLYLVQIGPIKNYQTARELKDKLSQKPKAQVQSISKPTTISKEKTPPESKLWNLRNADIRAVIAEVSRVTGKNFVIDPRVQGKISIVSSTPMGNDELYQVFLSVLQVSGYAAIPNGEIIKIIPNIDAKTHSPDLLPGQHPVGEDVMVSVVPLHFVPAEQLVPVIRPLMPQWSNVSAYGPSNMLILSGRANNIKSLTKIIQQVDSSDASGVDIVNLRNALAMDVVATMKELLKNPSAIPGAQGKQQISIAANDKTNSILISGSKTDRIRTRMLLLKLDRKSSEGLNSTTQVVYLNYLRAEDLVPILAGVAQANFSGTVGKIIGTITIPALDSTMPQSQLAGSGSGSTGSSSPTTPTQSYPSSSSVSASQATSGTSSATTVTEGSTKPTVQIIAEPNTNSIILSAPAAIIRTLKEVIAKLDIKPAQILIEAMVAEINEKNVKDLGVEWGTVKTRGDRTTFQNGIAVIDSTTSTADFQAQITALVKDQKANILSTPSVLVLDNRQAKIAVGQQISVGQSTQPSNANGTTNGGTPFTTFSRVNVTLHIYVRPQITKGDGIQLQIDQGNDTVDPATILSDNPVFNISAIVTSVHVNSGDIVVLGGLTKDDLSNNDNRIPILGDMPGLGRFFQHNQGTRQKRVLMVFIKPLILRNEAETVMASNHKYTHTRTYEMDWARSQAEYNKLNDAATMEPLASRALPRPFSHPTQLAKATK